MPANETLTEPLDRIGFDVPPLPPGRSVTLPGRGTMFVRDTGGPAEAHVVMLLHGLGATASLNWFTAFPALEDRFRVVATGPSRSRPRHSLRSVVHARSRRR